MSIAIDSKAVKDTDKRSYEEARLLDYMNRLGSLSQKQLLKSSVIKVSAETKEKADKNGISMGRQEAISIAAENGMNVTVDQIKDYNVKDVVKIIYDEIVKERADRSRCSNNERSRTDNEYHDRFGIDTNTNPDAGFNRYSNAWPRSCTGTGASICCVHFIWKCWEDQYCIELECNR